MHSTVGLFYEILERLWKSYSSNLWRRDAAFVLLRFRLLLVRFFLLSALATRLQFTTLLNSRLFDYGDIDVSFLVRLLLLVTLPVLLYLVNCIQGRDQGKVSIRLRHG